GFCRGQSFIWDARRRAPQAAYPNPTRAAPWGSYLALLRVGFALPRLLPGARCALTAPFHPYRTEPGGIFSVALSVGSRPPGVTWHSALWSPDFPPPRTRGSDCPADFPAIVTRSSPHRR